MEISRHWRLREQRYTLTGAVCARCGKTFFAPRPVCDRCDAPAAELYTFEHKHVERSVIPEYQLAGTD